MNTTISEADDKPEHIAEILRHWLKKRQQVIDTPAKLPDDDDGDRHVVTPPPVPVVVTGTGLFQTRRTAQRGL